MSENRDITRRDMAKFAGAAGIAAAAATTQFGTAPGIKTVRAANNQVQYGMIGTGSRGQYLLKHLKGIDAGQCVALCDINEENLKKGAAQIGGSPKLYKDYREMLADKNVEAVKVVTPLFMHFPITRDALLAGKHCFTEKSLVFLPSEVLALRKLCNERPKQVLQVGLQRRYSQYYQTVRQMVEKGLLGEVTHVQAQWHRNGLASTWVVKPGNWRVFRKMSGGLVTELASHQVDVADWMFGAHPEFVSGVGDLTWYKDGRDIYDNIQLIFKYPKGQKLIYSSIMTNSHWAGVGGQRTEFGETIMGTGGTVEITIGDDTHATVAVWFKEPAPRNVTQGTKKEETKAGATMTAAAGGRGMPVILPADEVAKDEAFVSKELKFARRWLYAKGIMVPEEPKNPVDVELESFFNDIRRGGRPKADLEVGLADAEACIFANIAMDEGRRVYFSEIDKVTDAQAMGQTPAAMAAIGKKS
jgi:predicted dehydrogenase